MYRSRSGKLVCLSVFSLAERKALVSDNDDELAMPRASKVVRCEAVSKMAVLLERCSKLVVAD